MTTRIDCRTVEEIVPGNWYVHPSAVFVGSCAEGCCDRYQCPDCHTVFNIEGADG